jgi:hypothetical protein
MFIGSVKKRKENESANSIIVNLLLALRDSNFFCFDDRSSPSRLRRAAQTVVTIIKLTALMITNGAKEYIIASTQGHTLFIRCAYCGEGAHSFFSYVSVPFVDCSSIDQRKWELTDAIAVRTPMIDSFVRRGVQIIEVFSGI